MCMDTDLKSIMLSVGKKRLAANFICMITITISGSTKQLMDTYSETESMKT